MQKLKVAIARFPDSGWEHTSCVEWLIKTVVEMKKDLRISDVISIKPGAGTPITLLRNKAVVDAKASKCDYLLMIDSDMAPDLPYPGAKPFWSTAWEFMMHRRRPSGPPGMPPATIAAPYCGPPPLEMPYFFRFTNGESGSPNPNFRLEMIPREMAAIMSGIQEMDALPTGLILYDMRVFDLLPPPWFRYEYTDKTESEKSTTEDVYQTRNAKLLGLPLYMAMDSWAGHMKTKVVTKPHIVTADQVHSSLVEAVKRGVDSQDRLITMEEPKANGADFTMTPSNKVKGVYVSTGADLEMTPDDWTAQDEANEAFDAFIAKETADDDRI